MLAVVLLLALPHAAQAWRIRVRVRAPRITIGTPRITVGTPTITVGRPKITVKPDDFNPVKVGQNIYDTTGKVVHRVGVAGEEITESTVYGARGIAQALEDPKSVVKHPLKLVNVGATVVYHDGIALFDLGDGVVRDLPGGAAVHAQLQRTTGESLYWVGSRLAQQRDFVENVTQVAKDATNMVNDSAVNVVRESLQATVFVAGPKVHDELGKLVNKSKPALQNVTSAVFDPVAPGIEGLGGLLKTTGFYVIASADGFPEPINNRQPTLEVPAVATRVALPYLQRILAGVVDSPLQFGRSNADKGKMALRDVAIWAHEPTNSLLIEVRDGQVDKNLVVGLPLRMSFHVRNMVIQLAPRLVEVDGARVVQIQARVLRVDVADLPLRLDEVLAAVLNHNVFRAPIAEFQVDSLLSLAADIRVDDRTSDAGAKRHVALPVKAAAIHVTNRDIELASAL